MLCELISYQEYNFVSTNIKRMKFILLNSAILLNDKQLIVLIFSFLSCVEDTWIQHIIYELLFYKIHLTIFQHKHNLQYHSKYILNICIQN